MLASFDLLEIEINSHTDSFSKKGMVQHSEASCTVGCIPITPSLALGKTVLNGKGVGGSGAWRLQSCFFHCTEGGALARGKKAIRHFKSRKAVDTSSKTQNLSVFMGSRDSASRADHKPCEHSL